MFRLLTLAMALSPAGAAAQESPAGKSHLYAYGEDAAATSVSKAAEAFLQELPKGIETVSVWQISDRTGKLNPSEVADDLERFLVNSKKVKVLDRQNLNNCLKEMKLSLSGLVNPEKRKDFGRAYGVQAFLYGEVVDASRIHGHLGVKDYYVTVLLKAFSVETGALIWAKKVTGLNRKSFTELFKELPPVDRFASFYTDVAEKMIESLEAEDLGVPVLSFWTIDNPDNLKVEMKALYDELTLRIANSKKYKFIDRAMIEMSQLMQEQQLTMDGISDPTRAAEVGKLWSVDGFIHGTLRSAKGTKPVYPPDIDQLKYGCFCWRREHLPKEGAVQLKVTKTSTAEIAASKRVEATEWHTMDHLPLKIDAAQYGELTLIVTPPDAVVEVTHVKSEYADAGAWFGEKIPSGKPHRMKAGTYEFKALRKDYKPLAFKIDLAHNDKRSVPVEMEFPFGALVVTALPERAAILIDGARVGEGSYKNEKMNPGDLKLRVELEDFHVFEQKITVKGASAPLEVKAELKPFPKGFVYVPKGKFMYGADDGEPDERPLREEEIEAGFYIGKFEVTNAEYLAFVSETKRTAPIAWGDGVTRYPEGFDAFPVSTVSWEDAAAYCQWRSKKDGKKFRLPTEKEWEKAARGSDGRTYPWGDLFEPTRACFGRDANKEAPALVGQFKTGKSVYWCQDMAGNVWEWTADQYMNPADPNARLRVIRGGGYNTAKASDLRCANKGSAPAGARVRFVGFRIVMEE